MIWICQNDLGFSLYTVLSVYCVVTTLDKWMKSKIEISTNISMSPLNIRDQVQ